MLNRRHIRLKVMQTLYAMQQTNSDNLEKEEKFLVHSLESVFELYLILLSILTEMVLKENEFIELSKNKHLATFEEKNPNLKFVNNIVFHVLLKNSALTKALVDRKINNWKVNDDYISLFLSELKETDFYIAFMQNKQNSFEQDLDFAIQLFETFIAPNTKLYEYLEDFKLTWIDDIPLVNTLILKQLKAIKNTDTGNFKLPKLFNDTEDKDFGLQLFKKTVLNSTQLAKEFANKTPNWEQDRIAEVDLIILKMAICEFLKFPSIPTKVTINEYLELAKEYSTPKSSIFINGILDNLVKEFNLNNRINKTGRGLL